MVYLGSDGYFEMRTNCTTTPVRRGNFDGVGWSRDNHDLNSETEDESTDDELWQCHSAGDDDGADDNNPCANEHALATAEPVGDNSTEWCRDDGTAVDTMSRVSC